MRATHLRAEPPAPRTLGACPGRSPSAFVSSRATPPRELADCLASAPFAGEIVVVDSGSGDDTVEIARRCGARVDRAARGSGFGAQKNFAVGAGAARLGAVPRRRRARDAGARRVDRGALAARRAAAPAAYAMARRNRFLGRWLAHGEGYPDWNVRLFDRRRARWTDDPVHEHVVADGAGRRASPATCCTRRPNRSTPTWPSRTATRRCRPRRCTRAASARARAQLVALAARALRPLLRAQARLPRRRRRASSTSRSACFTSFMKYAKLRALDADARGR